jgi:hypothetical protein
MTMEPTQKVCNNGHRMEPEWEVCPYCPSSRDEDPALARTVKVDATRMAGGSRPEPAQAPPPAMAAVSAPESRRTEIFQRAPTPGGVGWLVLATGPDRGKSHPLRGERMVIGAASGCEVQLDGDHVSDRHASLRFQEGRYTLTDLDSTNGTTVNGVPVQQQVLSDGDRVGLGGSEWVFKCVVFDETEGA